MSKNKLPQDVPIPDTGFGDQKNKWELDTESGMVVFFIQFNSIRYGKA